MPYPSLAPSSRTYGVGQYPVKTYKSQSGSELRILLGNLKFGGTLELDYQAISDVEATLFIDHYDEVFGMYESFYFPLETTNTVGAKAGWDGGLDKIGSPECKWRYAQQPVITSVYPGVSNVRVSLVLALGG